MAIKQDIQFVKEVLPDHYEIKEGRKPGQIHCKSLIGIPDDPRTCIGVEYSIRSKITLIKDSRKSITAHVPTILISQFI